MKTLIKEYLQAGHRVMPELAAQKLCAAYDIPCPPTRVGQSADECAAIGQAIGYPVVMKVLSRQIVHKSDVGGVIVGIQSAAEMAAAFATMSSSLRQNCPEATIDGYVVQKMMPAGIEVVVGALRNPQFGPVVMFGMGGIYIEVFKDVQFRLAPLSRDEALRQIKETRISELLKGVRGQQPSDVDALATLIVNTGKLIYDFTEVREIDFNPVLSYPDGCMAVDARIVIGN